jgi:hypothetical protein
MGFSFAWLLMRPSGSRKIRRFIGLSQSYSAATAPAGVERSTVGTDHFDPLGATR